MLYCFQWSVERTLSRPDWRNILETSVLEVNESGLVFSGSLSASGNIYQIEACLTDKTSGKFDDLLYECVECAFPS